MRFSIKTLLVMVLLAVGWAMVPTPSSALPIAPVEDATLWAAAGNQPLAHKAYYYRRYYRRHYYYRPYRRYYRPRYYYAPRYYYRPYYRPRYYYRY